MKITVKASTMVKPTTATPTSTNRVWLSNLDVMANFHVSSVYFYRSTDAADFFDPATLKAALSRTLVEFYPLAGRLNEGADGRIEIKCSGEGGLFVEAESDGVMGDISDFTPNPRPVTGLVPKPDYSQGVSSFPLLLVQMTRLIKCGGVSLGFAVEHRTVDGFSGTHFMKSWAAIARGGDISVKPFFDRRVLAARNPPSPCFTHLEYLLPPRLLENNCKFTNDSDSDSETMFSVFKLTRRQLDSLKAKLCQGTSVGYSTFEMLAGHVWRCVSKARGLPEYQETKLYIPLDGRFRLRPPLPPGYFGNVVFKATTVALCGELVSKPLEFAVHRVHEAITRMDDEYMRSAIDHLEVCGELDPLATGTAASFKCPNLGVVSWARFGLYEMDFGWGSPANLGFPEAPSEGTTFVLPTPTSDDDGEGSLLYAIVLPKEHMMVFQNLFYQI